MIRWASIVFGCACFSVLAVFWHLGVNSKVAVASFPTYKSQRPDITKYKPKYILGNPRKRASQPETPLPPISDPKIVNADESDFGPDDMVIGVEIEGQARAYSISQLTGAYRQIVNDVLADTPIAVTWFHLSHNGIVFIREVDEEEVTLQVSGKIWLDNLIMRDVETGSEWVHLLGTAMTGDMKGKQLQTIGADLVTWSVWKRQHPDTTALWMSPEAPEYTSVFYAKHWHHTKNYYKGRRDFMFGFSVADETHAIALEEMRKQPVFHFTADTTRLLATFHEPGCVVQLFEPNADGQSLDFDMVDELTMTDRQTRSRWTLIDGKCIDGELAGHILKERYGVISFRHTWQYLHPDSQDVEFPHQDLGL